MRKRYRVYFLVFAMSVFLSGGCGASDHTEDSRRNSAQEVEDASSREDISSGDEEDTSPQIVFEGQDILGDQVSSEIFAESKLTMVNVWATYCNPCLREMPGLGELAAEYASEEFRIIGIISDVQAGADQEMLTLAADLIEQTGADYPHLLLNESLYYALLTDVSAVPTTFFIDENGVVLDTVVGSREKSAWEEIINGLLEGR